MPRPKLPEEDKKGFVLRTRTKPGLFYAIKNAAVLHNVTISEEIVHRLTMSLTSGVPTQS